MSFPFHPPIIIIEDSIISVIYGIGSLFGDRLSEHAQGRDQRSR